MRPLNGLPLTVELIVKDGSVLTAQAVPVSVPADNSYVPFQVDLTYSVAVRTPALLVVTQSDDRIGGMMYLYSREIFINP